MLKVRRACTLAVAIMVSLLFGAFLSSLRGHKMRVSHDRVGWVRTEFPEMGIPSYISETTGSDTYARANATLFTLCRNDDLQTVVETILSWEDRFNHQYHYDWVFLNNEEFDEDFVTITSRLVSGDAKYGVISEDHWSVPEWIDRNRMEEGMRFLEEQGVQYSRSESYRFMCRYNSGLFYRHPLMLPYKYYWRVDADTKMMCDIEFDVFRYMEENDLMYAFTLTMHENMVTIPSLWESTLKFFASYPAYVDKQNLAEFVTDDMGHSYNGCHFWTNFEIANAEFWRSEAFSTYFDFLDHAGGFFYERWGDAPVHSLAAALMLPREKVAHFDFIGYFHPPLTHAPSDFQNRPLLRCGLNPARNFMWDDQYNCIREFYRAQDSADAIPARMEL